MDQSGVFFAPHINRTLQKKGSKTVHINSKGDKMRCTVNVACTMAGTMLPPFIIFKGQPGGRIEKKEVPTYPPGAYYGVQDNAWCDSAMMMKWINTTLKDWVEEGYKTSNQVPVLVLDSFSVHTKAETVNAIENIGCDVIIIPPGCTYLCQPVDVGINRSLKQEMKRLWEDWVEGLGDDLKQPPRDVVAGWIIQSLRSMSRQTIMNAWRKKNYSWVA